MNILAIDTATEACSAALYISSELEAGEAGHGETDNAKAGNGEVGDEQAANESVISRYQVAPRQHSYLILKMVDELLADAGLVIEDIDAIAFGRGPGSFMGLRIAAGVVQGIAFAHNIPVIPVSTLKTIAQRAYEETQNKCVLVAIDARMDEVYCAAYWLDDSGRWQLHDEERVIAPERVTLPELTDHSQQDWKGHCTGAGTGWASYSDLLLPEADNRPQTIIADCLPSAEAMVKLAIEEFKQGNTVSAAEAIPVYLRNDVAKKPKPVVL